MHQPTAEPRPSIYYNYQVFQPWLPSEHAQAQHHPVTIVGSGPAGMVTALELARHGVRSVVLSAEVLPPRTPAPRQPQRLRLVGMGSANVRASTDSSESSEPTTIVAPPGRSSRHVLLQVS